MYKLLKENVSYKQFFLQFIDVYIRTFTYKFNVTFLGFVDMSFKIIFVSITQLSKSATKLRQGIGTINEEIQLANTN